MRSKPRAAATPSAVSPFRARTFMSAPYSSRRRVVASWPKETAAIRAVVPSVFWALASAPLERRVCTVWCWLAFMATMKGSLELVISHRMRLIRRGFFECVETLKAWRSSEGFGWVGSVTGIGGFMSLS